MADFDPSYAREIFKGIYRLGPGKAYVNVYLVDCGDRFLMMDTGYNLEGLRAQLKALSIPMDAISVIAVSHCHADHVGCLAAVKRRTGAKVLAHRDDAAPIEKGDVIRTWTSMVPYEGFFAACPVDVKIGAEHPLDLGNRSFMVRHFHSHTSGSISIELTTKEGKFVMLGDVVYKDGGMGFLDFHNQASIPSYIENLEQLKHWKADWVLPAHGMWFKFSRRIINKAIKRLKFYADQPEFGTADSKYMTINNWHVPEE
jgi:glyoxylase-like metal-dependent hydrolase (beta-lactamase superfamily II)